MDGVASPSQSAATHSPWGDLVRVSGASSSAAASASASSRRYAGSLPSDLERAASKARFPASSSKASGEPTTSASVKEEIIDAETARLHKEQQDVVSGFMFPWERRQMQGGGELNTWEKYYWGVFVVAIAVFLFNRAGSWNNTEEELEKAAAEKRREEEMERLRVERARLLLAGGTILGPIGAAGADGEEEEDPFEGMSPEDIEEFVRGQTGAAADPFAGLSPEEIDEYVKKHNL